VLIIFLGLLYAVQFGNLIGGLWYVFIGLFLRGAARASYQQVVFRDSLKGILVRDLMDFNFVSVPHGARLDDIVNRVMLTSGLTELPVVDGAKLLGMVGIREIRGVERGLWTHVTAAEVMRRDLSSQVVSSTDEAGRLLSMAAGQEAPIPVVDGENLVGIVNPGDIARRLRLRMELT
jgi:CBS domain-containing protein